MSLAWYATSLTGEAANQNRDDCITIPVSRRRTKCLNFIIFVLIESSAGPRLAKTRKWFARVEPISKLS